jgi:hypothetical protein
MSGNTLRVEDEFEEIGTRTIDERKRLTLGDLIKDFRRVRLYRNVRGELFLKPVVEVPASEVWLYQNKEAIGSVARGLQDAGRGRVSKLDLKDL